MAEQDYTKIKNKLRNYKLFTIEGYLQKIKDILYKNLYDASKLYFYDKKFTGKRSDVPYIGFNHIEDENGSNVGDFVYKDGLFTPYIENEELVEKYNDLYIINDSIVSLKAGAGRNVHFRGGIFIEDYIKDPNPTVQ